MKKLLFILFIVFVSCSSDDDNSSSNNSPYSPPSWIQGTWGLESSGGLAEQPFYQFTFDDVCQITPPSTSLCWKEAVLNFPDLHSGSDITTETTYEASFIAGGGTSNLTFSFEKVSPTKILWINGSLLDNGNLELTKLD